jgi:hypothetical protein
MEKLRCEPLEKANHVLQRSPGNSSHTSKLFIYPPTRIPHLHFPPAISQTPHSKPKLVFRHQTVILQRRVPWNGGQEVVRTNEITFDHSPHFSPPKLCRFDGSLSCHLHCICRSEVSGLDTCSLETVSRAIKFFVNRVRCARPAPKGRCLTF